MKLVAENHATLELSVVDDESPIPNYSEGDVLIRAEFSTRGFSGSTDTWIMRSEWKRFVAEMAALERDRRGSAALESVSPEELRIEIRVLDHAGHTGFECTIGERSGTRQVSLTHSTLQFDPTMLPSVVKTLESMVPERAG